MKITSKHLNNSLNTMSQNILLSLLKKTNQHQIVVSERVGRDCHRDKTCIRVLLKDKKGFINLHTISILRRMMTHSVRVSLLWWTAQLTKEVVVECHQNSNSMMNWQLVINPSNLQNIRMNTQVHRVAVLRIWYNVQHAKGSLMRRHTRSIQRYA